MGRDDVKFIGWMLLAAVALLWLFGWLFSIAKTEECRQYSEVSSKETKMVGPYCYVRVSDEWKRLDELIHRK